MDEKSVWQDQVMELAEREWDVPAIRARLNSLRDSGVAGKKVDWPALLSNREEVLNRVQLRAEEYEYLTRSCSKGSFLALMDEFGVGNWEMVRGMSPFPGFGMTGGICGGVTGPLLALGLFFGSDDPEDYMATGRTLVAAREFIPRFTETLGSIMCPDLQEQVIFGRYMDQRAGQDKFEAFVEAMGFEKCALLPGMGARLAAEIILDSQEA